jgi:hypothetical protein
MPILLHKSLKEHDKLRDVVSALEDVRAILRCNNETFANQPGLNAPNGQQLWAELRDIFLKYFGASYVERSLKEYTRECILQSPI